MALTPKVRSRWTSEDEAKLVELTARKARIMDESKTPVRELVGLVGTGNDWIDQVTDGMVARADAFVEALTPFCTDEHAAVTKLEQTPGALAKAAALAAGPALSAT